MGTVGSGDRCRSSAFHEERRHGEGNQWQAVGAIGAIGSGVTVLHGLTSKNWTTAHTVFTIGGIVAAVGSLVSNPRR